MRHLTAFQISASVDGVLQGGSQDQVVRHLAECDVCRGQYEELATHQQVLTRLLTHDGGDSFFDQLLREVETEVGDERAPAARPRPTIEPVESTAEPVADSKSIVPEPDAAAPVAHRPPRLVLIERDPAPRAASDPTPEARVSTGRGSPSDLEGRVAMVATTLGVVLLLLVGGLLYLRRTPQTARPVARPSSVSGVTGGTDAGSVSSAPRIAVARDPIAPPIVEDEAPAVSEPPPIVRSLSPSPSDESNAEEPAAVPKPRVEAPRASRATSRKPTLEARLCGVIRDAAGAPVPRAQVLAIGTSFGALSDASGHFCLNVTPGAYTLSVSALGFPPARRDIQHGPGHGEAVITLRPFGDSGDSR
ncbi:MAG: hypothetical protein HOP12_09350 [Candidatus Eisenbacteria bacterium]|uniref:Putative zinc-finger domain-containing protein n=1 Tax=Eiseniibacteriota bacterium TaxID=2212470 RepID=A0A849SIV6_UNCEI|nr:hypothetical protein [Candidatus Eisenbacteria bacterium]